MQNLKIQLPKKKPTSEICITLTDEEYELCKKLVMCFELYGFPKRVKAHPKPIGLICFYFETKRNKK